MAWALLFGLLAAAGGVTLWQFAAWQRRRRLELLHAEQERNEMLRTELMLVAARRRKRLREDLALHAELARTVSALVKDIEAPSDGTARARLKETVTIAAMEDRAVATVDRDAKNLWPPARRLAASEAVSDDGGLKRLERVLQVLDRNSVAIVGVEQIFLNLLALPSHTEGLSLAVQHLGGVLPEPFHEAATNFMHSVLAARVGEALHGPAGDMLHGIAQDAALRLLEHGPGPIAEIFTGGEILSIVAKGAGSGLRDGALHHVVETASPHLVEAIGHIDPIGGLIHGVSIGDASGAHFPILTAILSGRREVQLLKENKTSLDIALKNAGLDVGGTGIGAFAGAQGGAAVGTAVFPGPGTLVGGVLGAVIGAISIRTATNGIKRAPLRKAVQAYEQEWATAPARRKELQARLTSAVLQRYSDGRRAFVRSLEAPPTRNERAGEWRTVAIGLRNAATDGAEKARAAVTMARRWTDSDRALASDVLRLGPALQLTDAAISTSEQRIAKGDYAAGILPLAAAPIRPPVETCARGEEILVPLVEQQRVAVARWIVATTDQFKTQKKIFEEAVAPDAGAYRQGCAALDAAMKAAEGAVKLQKDRLGL